MEFPKAEIVKIYIGNIVDNVIWTKEL